jgi:hypothetical protein
MLPAMTLRRSLGLAAAAGYVALLAHATAGAGAQCPVRGSGACAQVHALMREARPPAAEPAPVQPVQVALAALPAHPVEPGAPIAPIVR